jgi:hypothetical protein
LDVKHGASQILHSAPTERLRQRWCAGKADPPLLFGKDRMRSIYRFPSPSRSGQGPKLAGKLQASRFSRGTTDKTASSYPGFSAPGVLSAKCLVHWTKRAISTSPDRIPCP